MEEDDELFGEFLEEAKDIIESSYDILREFLDCEDKEESLNALFRGVHTVKGSCAMFEMNNLSSVAHELESYIGDLKSKADSIDSDTISHILKRIDLMSELLLNGDQASDYSAQGSEVKAHKVKENINLFEDDFEKVSEYVGPGTKYFQEFFNTYDSLYNQLKSSGNSIFEFKVNSKFKDKVESLSRVGIKVLDVLDLDDDYCVFLFYLEESDFDRQYKVLESLESKNGFSWIYNAIKNDPEAPADNVDAPVSEMRDIMTEKKSESKKKQKRSNEVIRVPEDRINHALDNIWELFLVRNQLTYLMEQNYDWLGDNPEFIRSWELLEKTLETNITELESRTMRMRMASLKNIFSRLSKVVRTYSSETGKKIDFQTIGEDIELDKKVIDMLYEPLVHLMRNAMDHGLESADERIKAGKMSDGTICLSARILGSEVVIEIKDDGKGIDAKKILEIAESKGINTDNIESDEEAINLIFVPGFSTAHEVSSISGRGVGMDAVRNSVDSVGGSLEVTTELGQGSVISITLPLSMSVTSALVMSVNGVKFACTTSSIFETKIVSSEDLKVNSGELFFMRDSKYLPCIDLRSFLFKEYRYDDPFIKRIDGTVCLIDYRGKHVSLRVDQIIDYSNLVIKQSPATIPQVPFVIGVSILATGEPIFVISLSKLYDHISTQKHTWESLR